MVWSWWDGGGDGSEGVDWCDDLNMSCVLASMCGGVDCIYVKLEVEGGKMREVSIFNGLYSDKEVLYIGV